MWNRLTVQENGHPRAMSVRTALLLCLALAACGPKFRTEITPADDAQIALELRETFVASSLDLLRIGLDLAAPTAGDFNTAALEDISNELGCSLEELEDGSLRLACEALPVRGEETRLVVTLSARAEGVGVIIESESGEMSLEADLHLASHPTRGLTVEGVLFADTFDGAALSASLAEITLRNVADLPGLPRGVIFTSGNVDFSVRMPSGGMATGTAGLVGRRAVIALELGGSVTRGEIELGSR
jgi:hypothetical protein